MAMATHWQYSESFADTNFKMFENEDLFDVTLEAGNEKKQIKCHKFILASRSPVFYAMFCGTLAESKDVICVPDIEPSTLEHLLRYLYSGKVEINAEIALSLLYAARKYDIPVLEIQCKSFLSENMDTENVCTILDQAIVFDDKDLKDKSLEFIMLTKSESVLKSNAFVRMSKSGLQEVLNLDILNASECEVYVGCKRWASQRCRDAGKQETDEHIRQELGDEVISLIRFPTMTPEDFTHVVSTENVLKKDELISIYRSITNKNYASKFINEPQLDLGARCLFVRCTSVGQPWGYGIKGQDGLSFTVSKNCELTAVDMFLPASEGSVTGVLELIEGTKLILSQNVTLYYKQGVEHLLVYLDKSLILHHSNEYSIRIRMEGASGFFCVSTANNISMEGVTMTFSDLKVGLNQMGT
ncbi:BTB/POZ domain-containing protein 6-like [Dreissena polymorpha]|uniref:BTB/POZ domain-containing protein 6-like n=1 Tax=Dreissena polymorpha TaxID=45954 RepID=UPI002263CA2F|nr:BTB/POZ domain-containing protein 6-like [Dreissena polymorpha]